MFTSPSTVRTMKSGAAIFSLVAFALAGCAAPLVTPKLPTFQSKIGHAADWGALADRTAQRFADAYGGATAVYVAPGPADMPFAAAYRNFLEQALLQRHFTVLETASPAPVLAKADCTQDGCPIQETVSPAVVLRFGVQTFLYRNGDDRPFPVGYASFWSAAYALGVVARHVSRWDTGAAIVGGAGPVIDMLAAMGDTTKAEVVLTLTASDGARLVYRDSETVYVHPEELLFYWTHMPDAVPQAKAPDITMTALSVRPGSR
jgi:hypothetical protein